MTTKILIQQPDGTTKNLNEYPNSQAKPKPYLNKFAKAGMRELALKVTIADSWETQELARWLLAMADYLESEGATLKRAKKAKEIADYRASKRVNEPPKRRGRPKKEDKVL